MEEKQDDSQRTSAFDRISPHVARVTVFERLSMTEAERKDHQSTSNLDRRSTFQRLTITFKEEKGPYVQTGSNIDIKKKESISRVSVCHRIKHIDVESRHGKEFPCEEDSEQGEGEISCHHITILEELEIETLEEDAEDIQQSLEDSGESTVNELKELYKEMPGLDPKVAVHHLAIKPGYRPIKQAQRRFRPELIPQIEVKVNKFIEVGFIREVKYPTWIANIFPIRKKNGQLRVCIDFCDLNNACLKDDFLLPITEIMVDATTEHKALSFMDSSSGYNQIRTILSDEEMTAFKTPKGIYSYKVMPFGLKNAGATYQRAMQKVFDDMLHKYVECYVDDLVVKSKRRQDHLKDLKVVLDRLQKYQLRMNPLKCAFGVTSRKFLGFIVRHRGIKIDQSKINAIQKMPRPKSLHDLRSLQGRLAYIRRFISNLVGRCHHFQKLMRKGETFVWDEACQNAFDSIKKYLLNPPILGASVPGELLILYIAAQERSLGALLAQEKEKGKECALYYLSRTLVGAEVNYSPIEKMCLALFFAINKLRHYMQAFTVHLVAKADPIKHAIKGQALVDFFADHPIPSDWKLYEDLPNDEVFFMVVVEPWTMYFDGTTRRSGAGAGIVLISPEKHMLPYSFALAELCSNNVAEYQALIIGLQMALEIGVSFIEIYGDSKLIINQLSLQYDVKHEDLKPYFTYSRQLMERFDSVMLEHVPRTGNKRADALANLATALMMSDNEANVTTSHLIGEEDWRQPIIEYLEHGKLQKDSRHKTKEESIKALEEAHAGVCGVHQSGPKLQFQLRRIGYYWPKMVQDSMDYAKKCEACQYHANFIHQPPEPLHPTVASWPFEALGLDLVCPITPKSSTGHSYILAATDYFSKWAKAIPLREAKKENVTNFIRTHIIYRYAANGLAEAFNKTLCNILKKIVSKSKRDWQERSSEALWAYRTTHRTPTGVTLYSLVYGVEAVLPLEREIPSLRMPVQEGLTTEDNVKLRLQELEALDEKRVEAQQALECYQA
ncbi:RNase H family protein [Cucumis melo var. makuwa]|uniref:RNase H family protein n=1 Tax=Cucumis melo var. makuwa TaxID=1194695 RepID=A0A5D3DKL6_CUCMM|nr:RNase H family protein [Cucumis melo var. makuwa]